MTSYFVRIGSLAEIRAITGPTALEHGDQVIIRTAAGIQHAEVLGPCADPDSSGRGSAEILRRATEEDRLLIRRLNRHKNKTVERCRTALAQAGSQAVLLDVDPSFDGHTLFLQFLGPVDSAAESVSKKLAAEYETVAQIRHFEKLLADGCGPDCGTEGTGCVTGSCTGCTAAVACKSSAS